MGLLGQTNTLSDWQECYKKLKHVMPHWGHQKQAIDSFADKNFVLLNHEPGLGKTFTSSTIYRMLCVREERILKLLILAPTSMLMTWERELKKFCSPQIARGVRVAIGSESKRVKLTKDVDADIIITNHESLGVMADFTDALKRWLPEVIICDEMHRFKNPSAKRTKHFVKLVDNAKYKLGLTGTPILNSVEDAFIYLRIAGGVYATEKNIVSFRLRYMHDENASFRSRPGYFPKWVARPDRLPELNERLSKISHIAKKAECLSLPPFITKQIDLELPASLQKTYRDLERDFVATIKLSETEQSVIMTDMVITKMLRLLQICSGVVAVFDDPEPKLLSCAKEQALSDTLEEVCGAGHKIIVWTTWRQTYGVVRQIAERLGYGSVSITGGQSVKDRDMAVNSFNNDPGIQVCVANPAAGGVGIGLQAASYMLYYSYTHNLEQDEQSQARAYRGGSERHAQITRINCVTRGTIEERVMEALQSKRALGAMLTEYKRTYHVDASL